MNDILKFQLDIISPVHVGGANEKHLTAGLDFFEVEGQHYTLDFNTFLQKAALNGEIFSDLTNKLSIGKLNKFFEKYTDLLQFAQPIDFIPTSKEIKTFVRSGFSNQPYIPGSSLKGALSSILFATYKNKKDTIEDVLGTANNSIMRLLICSDVPFKSTETETYSTKIFNLHTNKNIGGWKFKLKDKNNPNESTTEKAFRLTDFATNFEVLPPQKSSFFELKFQKGSFKLFNDHLKRVNNDKKEKDKHKDFPDITKGVLSNIFELKSYETFFELINKHTLKHVKAETKFWEKYAFDSRSEKVRDFYVDLIEKINTLDHQKECMLRLSSGSGFHSISGNWQFDDYDSTGFHGDGKKKYKSRRVAFDFDENNFLPMGFIKLTKIEAEQPKKIEPLVPDIKASDYIERKEPTQKKEQVSAKSVFKKLKK